MVDRLKIEQAEERHQLRKRIAELAAENERLKQRIADYQRDTSTVVSHETANVSDKPEGQQPVAWLTNLGWIDSPSYTVSFEGDKSGCENFPVYTRPSEQAVTEAMVVAAADEIVDAAEIDFNGTILNRAEVARKALKAAMEAGG